MKTRVALYKTVGKTTFHATVTSEDLTNVEVIKVTTSYRLHESSKIFQLDENGDWYSALEMQREGYKRTKLTINATGFSMEDVFVSEEEAQEIIEREAAILEDEAKKVISWCNPEDENDEEGRYWLSAYHGAGVYRLIIKNKKIQGAIYGGFHDCDRSVKSMACSDEAFVKALEKVVSDKIGTGFHFIKADGSGTLFFLRYAEDEQFLETKEYDVPSATGLLHRNIEII